MKYSSGILFWKMENNDPKFLLVHPSGEYNKKAKWSIPKGELDKNESIIEAALREVEEEIGIVISEKDLEYFGYCIYQNKKKRVDCFSVKANFNESDLKFSWEIDQAKFFSLQEAVRIIHPDQKQFLDNFIDIFNSGH